MSTPVPASQVVRRFRRAGMLAVGVLALSMVVAPATFAGKPDSSPSVDEPFTVDGVCTNEVAFSNTTIKGTDSLFDVKRNGSQRWMTRGMAVSLATDLHTGATYGMKGGFHFTVKWAADGSYRVDATGSDILAWYFPGDDSELGPGLWDISGHATEYYAADDTFLRATFSGRATDVCAALGS